MEKFEHINGINLGYGFNTATYDIHSPALEDVSSTRDVVSAGGQEVYFRVELSSSTVSLSQQLNVSARAKLKFGVVASGSLKTSFFSQFKQNSYSIYVFVQAIVTNKETLLDLSKVKLKGDAANLFAGSPQDFTQRYGDSFIYGLITGGEFLGILEVESSSASEFREIKAKLSGKGTSGIFSGNAKASFEQALESITSEYQMKATIMRQGGEGSVVDAVTSSELIKKALLFPDEVKGNNGHPYIALAIPYNHIERPVSSPLDLTNQTATLEQLGSWRERFIKYQNDLEFALDHPAQFSGIDTSKVSDRFNQISSELTIVVDAARSCFVDQTKCSLPKLNISLLENILPPQMEGVDDMAKLEEQIKQLTNELAATKQSIETVKVFSQSVVFGQDPNPPFKKGFHDYTFTPPGATRALGGWWSLQHDVSQASSAYKQFMIACDDDANNIPRVNGNSVTFRVTKLDDNPGRIRVVFFIAYV